MSCGRKGHVLTALDEGDEVFVDVSFCLTECYLVLRSRLQSDCHEVFYRQSLSQSDFLCWPMMQCHSLCQWRTSEKSFPVFLVLNHQIAPGLLRLSAQHSDLTITNTEDRN